VFYDLNTKQADPMPTPMRRRTSYPPIVLPANTLAVEHLYQRSRDQGLTIYVMVRDVTTEMLPELQTVTREEEIYMRITLNEPASVRGDYRHRQHVAERTAGWSFERWRQVRARLLKRHLVNGNSVLTKWGLNVLTYRDSKLLRHLKTAAPIHAAR
jgi:hypothetical protein